MRRQGGMFIAGLLAALFASGCAGGPADGAMGKPQVSEEVLKGGQLLQPWLGAALKEAGRHKLGSEENPVRADMPGGQRAYLARLRCTNGAAPTWSRVGNLGSGVFGSIVDQYDLRCEGAHPPRTIIVMDMYFKGYVEARAIEGFKIAPP
jgi:hypothetical protein